MNRIQPETTPQPGCGGGRVTPASARSDHGGSLGRCQARVPRGRSTILHGTSAVVVVAVVAFLVAGCGDGRATNEPARSAVPVRVAQVSATTTAPTIHGTGLLGPRDQIALSFKIGGIVERVLVESGDRVVRGELLAALDPREIDARLRQAESAAEKAARDFARAERLHADSVATLEQLQDARTAREVAAAALEAARFDHRHATIVAPASGVILVRSAEAGELVAPGQPILALGSRERGSVVRVGLADRDALRIRHGDRATVRLDLRPPRAYVGEVAEIAGAADPATGTFRVEVAVTPEEDLGAGLVAAVEIRPSAATPVALVPIEAVLEADGDQAVVYSVDAATGRARRHTVELAYLDGAEVAITSGLEGVTQVVTEGSSRLAAGDSVKVIP